MARNNRGYAIIGVLFISVIGLVLTAGMLSLSATNTKTRALVKQQAEYYYEAEETLNKTVAWLQANSKNLVKIFTRDYFDGSFDISASPTVGANEGEFFQVPTMVKLNGSDDSAMLSNNEFFGEAAFPASSNIDTNAAFDAVDAFRTADLGTANARAVIVWARETDGNYEPIFRVDAVTGNNPDRGAHTFTYVYSKLEATPSAATNDGIGFFTETRDLTTKNGNNRCDSYLWAYNGGVWSKGAPRSNCVVASKRNIVLEGRISGDALSSLADGVKVERPKGEVSGTVCGGAACHAHSLLPFPEWAVTCAGKSQGDLNIVGEQTLASGNALENQCWGAVHVQPNSRLILNDTDHPYRFQSLTFHNNSNAQLVIPTLEPPKKVTIYVDNFDGGQINGLQMFNVNNAPRALEVNVTSAAAFKLNGTADMHARFIAPLANVEMLGTFNFHGAIEANGFDVTGNGTFNYDEGIAEPGVPVVTDITFALKKASQRYR